MKKVKEGYKITEVGEIPDEWEVKKLQQVFEVCQYGISNSLSDEGKYPVLRMNNIKKGKVILDNFKFIDLDENEFNKYSLNRNDILFNRTNSIDLVGKTGIYDSDEVATFASYLIRIKTNNKIAESKFVNYYMNSDKGQERIRLFATLGVSQANINAENLKKVLIPIAPIKEQQKISLILSSVDEKIENTNNLIEKIKELKKGLMQRLLTKGIGHDRFKDTEIGRIPEEWEVKRLRDIGEIVTGNTPKTAEKENYGLEHLWVSPSDMGEEKYINKTNKMLSKLGFEKTRKLPEGSILITCIGSTIGKIGIASYELSTNQQINSIICNPEYDNEFIYYVIDFNFSNYISYISTQAVPIINKTTFSGFQIQIPTLEEQKKISLIISSIDEKIDKYESKKEKLQQLKKALMQKLLTGKIRVKV